MLGQLEEVRGEDDLPLGYLWLLIATDNLPIIKASLLPFQELEDSYFFDPHFPKECLLIPDKDFPGF